MTTIRNISIGVSCYFIPLIPSQSIWDGKLRRHLPFCSPSIHCHREYILHQVVTCPSFSSSSSLPAQVSVTSSLKQPLSTRHSPFSVNMSIVIAIAIINAFHFSFSVFHSCQSMCIRLPWSCGSFGHRFKSLMT